MPVQRVYRRKKALPLQSVAIQVVRVRVRCRDQGHAVFEQSVEQPAEDHRVADIADEELVEAQHARFCGHVAGDRGERILDIPQRAQPVVHILHDAVEVRAALRVERQRLEEEIHKEGLAAADAAPDIKTRNPRRRIAFKRQEPCKTAFWWRCCEELLLQPGK